MGKRIVHTSHRNTAVVMSDKLYFWSQVAFSYSCCESRIRELTVTPEIYIHFSINSLQNLELFKNSIKKSCRT